MKILFKAPPFGDKDSEKKFHQSLSSIPAYKDVEEMGTHLLLELDNSLTLETIKALFALFDDWSIDKSPLESFNQLMDM